MEPAWSSVDRDSFVLSAREDRPADVALMEGVMGDVRALQLPVVALAQVRRDSAWVRQFADRQSTVASPFFDEQASSDQLATVCRTYQGARFVLSNRLHALYFALVNGSVPLALAADRGSKAAAGLASIGLGTLVVRDPEELRQVLQQPYEEVSDLTSQALVDARSRLDRMWGMVAEHLHRSGVSGAMRPRPAASSSGAGPGSLVVLQLAMEHYRQHFLDAVEESRDSVRFLVGDEHFGQGVGTRVTSPLITRTGRNVFLLGRRLGWQRQVLRVALAADVAVVELNPRLLTSWVVLLGRRALHRPSVAWGHAWPRTGRQSRSDRLRGLMRRLPERIVVYTDSSAAELRDRLAAARVFAAPNSLYSSGLMTPAVGDAQPPYRTGSGVWCRTSGRCWRWRGFVPRWDGSPPTSTWSSQETGRSALRLSGPRRIRNWTAESVCSAASPTPSRCACCSSRQRCAWRLATSA